MNNHAIDYRLKQYSCQVSAVVPLSENAYQIDLLAADDASLDYHAGQHLQLDLSPEYGTELQSLSYTIANSRKPDKPKLLQLIIHNSSEFSGKIIKALGSLCERNKCAKVTLPLGKAYLQTSLDQPHVLIAAGSGIAKIKCIAEEIVSRHPDADVTIYWSNRSVSDFYLLDFFRGIENACKKIKFIPVLEAKLAGWSGRSGYIYKVVKEDFDSLQNTKMYLCGSPAMVYGTMDQLKILGLKEENCYSDVFEYAPRLRESEG